MVILLGWLSRRQPVPVTSQGVASIKVTRAALNVNGAGTLDVYTGDDGEVGSTEQTVVSAVLDYQLVMPILR